MERTSRSGPVARFFQPDPSYRSADDPSFFGIDQRVFTTLVGLVALGLPLVLLAAHWWFQACDYESISHFYYSRFFGDVLVAALAFIGTFLFAYRGRSWRESRIVNLAGLLPFGVAFFPTTGDGCHTPGEGREEIRILGRALVDLKRDTPNDPVRIDPDQDVATLFELFPGVDFVHFGSAAAFFAFLAVYTFCVFARVDDEEHRVGGKLKLEKKIRNSVYYACGTVIVVSMVALVSPAINDWLGGEPWKSWDKNSLTFWFESFALWAFGLAWMVKGRFFGLALLDQRDKSSASKSGPAQAGATS